MKTVKKQVEEMLNEPFSGHPSREEEAKIRKLEVIVLKLAQQIDILIFNQK